MGCKSKNCDGWWLIVDFFIPLQVYQNQQSEMRENLNWGSFSEQYHLKNDKYVQDVALLQRLQKTDCYPVILYPKLLCEQLSKKFVIGSIGVGKDKSHIFLHDFLNAAKQLNIKGDEWQFLIHPFDPKDAAVPQMTNKYTD